MIGTRQKLIVKRKSVEGFYLSLDNKSEVLLPQSDNLGVFNIWRCALDVFIYKDSNNRLVGTTKKPKIMLEEFAYLQVKQVNRFVYGLGDI